jgi:hypothetical protein
MIVLSSGANTRYLTLTEKSTLVTPVYVFVFESNANQTKFMCTTSDLSVDAEGSARRNKFIFTVQASPNWLVGQILPPNYGDYTYYAYECSTVVGLVYNTIINADLRTYVPTYFTTLVETGQMKYLEPATTDGVYKDTAEQTKSYEPTV